MRHNLQQQTGVALLAALILIMAVVLSLSSIFFRHQLDVSRLTTMLHSDQALLLGLSAETWAKKTLADDDTEIDDFDEPWAVAVPLLPVEGGYLQACMVDLQSRLNINSFADYNSERWSTEMSSDNYGLVKTWLNLLNILNLPSSETHAASIIDWLDSDSEPINQWGAEQNNYANERSGLMVPNTLMTDVSELSVIKGFNIGVTQRVSPWLSTLPESTAININTADETMLLAIGGKYAKEFTAAILTARPFSSLDAMRLQLETSLSLSANQTLLLWPEELLSVTSNFFLLKMHITLGEVQLEIQSVMKRSKSAGANVIRRNVAVIPKILLENTDSISATDEHPLHTTEGPQFSCQTQSLSSDGRI